MRSNYKRLGDYIREVDVRNIDDDINILLGINIDKFFMPSVANVVGTDLSRYKVVSKDQLACNRMHVGRDKRLPVALSAKEEHFIVSPAYDVFEIIDKQNILPDYLMMWFSRSEFDRNTWFFTDADVRGGLNWNTFLGMQLPVPHIDIQREIVAEYNAVQKYIDLNNQQIKKLEETAQAIYKEWFVDFEFPNENGKPYKSSSGEMEESVLGKIPKGWRVEKFTDIIKLSGGGTPDTNNESFWDGDIKFFTPADVTNSFFCISTEKYISKLGLEKSSTKFYPQNTIFISARGTVGALAIAGCPMAMNQSCYALRGDNPFFVHQTTLLLIEKLKREASGAVFSALVTKDFEEQRIIYPGAVIEYEYQLIVENLYDYILKLTKEIGVITEFKSLLLSKMASIEK